MRQRNAVTGKHFFITPYVTAVALVNKELRGVVERVTIATVTFSTQKTITINIVNVNFSCLNALD